MDKKLIKFVLFLLIIAAEIAVADYYKPPEDLPFMQTYLDNEDKLYPFGKNWYLGGVLGAGIANAGKNQTNLVNGINNGYWIYTPNGRRDIASLFGINGGYEFKLNPSSALFDIGLGLYQNFSYKVDGLAYYEYYPLHGATQYLQYKYNYKVTSTRLMLEAQVSWPICFNTTRIIPFIFLGIGPALNLTHGYQEEAVGAAPATNGFKSKININFAYQLGLGIAYPFNYNRSRLSINYRYVNLGNPHFGARERNVYQLETGQIKANEFYLGYTHFFDI